MSISRGLLAAVAAAAVSSASALAAEPAKPTLRYIPPVTNPTFAESPMITTELRPIYIHHDIPGSFATAGGEVNVIALQARLALTDRLALIATKDGLASADYGALPDDDGILNIAAGLKYAVIDEPEAGHILTVGARYEMPVGNLDAGPFQIQGKGKGFANLFASGVKQWGNFQVQASGNAHIAIDPDVDSSMLVGSLQVNYAVLEDFLLGGFYPLVELNVFHYLNDPGRTPLTAAGFDVLHLGQSDSDTVVSGAVGFRMHITDGFQMGGAVEMPLTDDNGEITNWRVTADAIIRF